MASITRLTAQIRIAACWYNGGYRLFNNTSALYKVFNARFFPSDIFDGSPVTDTLQKVDLSNLFGYRLNASFNLTLPKDTSGLFRDLFNQTSGGYNRTVFSDICNADETGSTALALVNAPNIDDYFNGTVVSGLVGGDVLVTDYVGATKTATLASARTWSLADAVTFSIRPNYKTLLAVSTDTDAANFVYYNILSRTYAVNREKTLNRQEVGLTLSSVDPYAEIPDSFEIL